MCVFVVWLVAVLFAYVLLYYVVNIERYPSRKQNFDVICNNLETVYLVLVVVGIVFARSRLVPKSVTLSGLEMCNDRRHVLPLRLLNFLL